MTREHELARWFADRDEATAAPLRTEIERQRQYIAELEDLHCFKGLRAEIERLRAALQAIEHETGMTMLATNHGRRGDLANTIARAALERKP